MHSDENVKKIFMKIERIDRKLSNGDVGKLSIPLSEKENLKLVTRSEIEKVKYCELVRQSENIFDSYIARRNGHFKKSVL